MKKTWMVMIVIVMALMGTMVFAETLVAAEGQDVTVKGDKVRGAVVANLINSYFRYTEATAKEDDSLGEHVVVINEKTKATEKIHFSPKLVKKLQKFIKNPEAGEGLLDICSLQASALKRVVGPIGVSTKATVTMVEVGPQDPKIDFLKATEKTSVCAKKGGCYEGKILTGSYKTLQPYEGIRVVMNNNNPLYPENSIRLKAEAHYAEHVGWPYGSDWGPTVVLCNITMENPMRLLETNASLFVPYLKAITAIKKGQPFVKDGDSCWEVVILRDGTIYKDESPAEAPFCRRK